MKKIITRNFDVERMHDLKIARDHGAYASLEKLASMSPPDVIAAVAASGLRGRGGAGFPTGAKWNFIPADASTPIYLVVNADESEPGTFKDRAILERDPHLIIEGIAIAAYAIRATAVFAYFRGEYHRPQQRFEQALNQARDAGLLAVNGHAIDIITHRGAGAYICGEETALLGSIEGLRGLPRIKPPFPATHGLSGCPTIVNNIETLAALPFIVQEGAKAYRQIGTQESAGTKLMSACGHINSPGVYEIEMGMPLATFLANECGGTIKERALKAIIPGGPSVPVLTAQEALGAKLDFESLKQSGSLMGSGGFIVMDETTCMPCVLADIARFFDHESCGQCTPCREGTGWIHRICKRIADGAGREGDIELVLSLAGAMPGRTVCVFADALTTAVTSFITKFKGEFEEHLLHASCR